MLDELAQLRHRLHVRSVGGLDRAEGRLLGGHDCIVPYAQASVTLHDADRQPEA
jgi:hypothetical protein